MLNPLITTIVNPTAIVVAVIATLLVVLVSSLKGGLGARDGHLGRGTPTTRRRRARDRVPRPGTARSAAVAAAGDPAGGEGEEGELEDGAAGGSGPGDIPEDEVEYFEVEFVRQQGETVELSNNEPILDQGEDQGWDLPYALPAGPVCLLCRSDRRRSLRGLRRARQPADARRRRDRGWLHP